MTGDMFDHYVGPTLLQMLLDFISFIPVRDEPVIWVGSFLIGILYNQGDKAFAVCANCGLHRVKI
jgi:hypothetical protein